MTNDCEFCKNKFVNKCGLLYHQCTAKYCLKLQGITSTKYICKFCEKNLEEKCGLPQKIKEHEHSNISLQKQLQIANNTISILKLQI
jgi:hypothetical protein